MVDYQKEQTNNLKYLEKPAILGGEKEFKEFLPIVKPTLPNLYQIWDQMEEVLNSGMVTNFSKYVQLFEQNCNKYLGTDTTFSLPNATTGLMLSMQALNLTGEVIVPSFTFSATVHTIVWNNLTPVFVDIDPETYNINPDLIEAKITPKTSAILAVHIFGNPCDIDALTKIAKKHNLKLIFDSSHGFGSLYQGKKIGNFGDAEIFSMSGTKLLVTGEGGLITSNNPQISKKLELGRNYGAAKDYNCQFIGFNGKMPEFCAIIGLESLKTIDKQVQSRNRIVSLFKEQLKDIPGIAFQKIKENNLSAYKDFSIVIDKNLFGINRDELANALLKENIHNKKYFYPAIHMMTAYEKYYEEYHPQLPITTYISENILCLPIHSKMTKEQVEKISNAIKKIHFNSNQIMALKEKVKSVLITGGAGYVGVVLAKKLLQQGYHVNIIDKLIYGKEAISEIENHPNFKLFIGVVEDSYILEKSLEGMDAVIHLSGLSNDPSCELSSDLTKKANIDATQILLGLSKKKGVKRFINASSCSVYGFTEGKVVNEKSDLNPLTTYAKSKVKSEVLVKEAATDDFITTSLRKATIYGPSKRMRFDLVVNTMTGMGISEGKITINGGEQWRPFLHVEDAADSYIFLLNADKEKINKQIFNIGSNHQNIKIIDLAHRIAKKLPGIVVEQSENPDTRSYKANFDKINQLGWHAKLDIEDGVEGVKQMFASDEVKNFRDLNYFNIKRMITYLNV